MSDDLSNKELAKLVRILSRKIIDTVFDEIGDLPVDSTLPAVMAALTKAMFAIASTTGMTRDKLKQGFLDCLGDLAQEEKRKETKKHELH